MLACEPHRPVDVAAVVDIQLNPPEHRLERIRGLQCPSQACECRVEDNLRRFGGTETHLRAKGAAHALYR